MATLVALFFSPSAALSPPGDFFSAAVSINNTGQTKSLPAKALGCQRPSSRPAGEGTVNRGGGAKCPLPLQTLNILAGDLAFRKRGGNRGATARITFVRKTAMRRIAVP